MSEQAQARRIEMLAIAAMAICSKNPDTCAGGLVSLAAMREHPDFLPEFNTSEYWRPEDLADCMAMTVGEEYADSIFARFEQPTPENARPIDLVASALAQAFDTPLKRFLDAMPDAKVIRMPEGNTVLCDSCSRDYTAREDKGGLLFQSKAICPVCLPRWLSTIAEEGEQQFIRARCPEDKAFADWVRDDVRTGKVYL